MFRPIPGLNRAGHNRIALHAANVTAIAQPQQVNIRDTKVGAIKRTGIHAETGWIDLVVDINDLGEPRQTKPALKNLVVASGPGPAQAQELRSRWSDGVE